MTDDIDIFIHFLIILILIIEEDQIEKFHIIIYRINQKPKYVTFWRIFFKKYHTPEIYHNISHGLTSDLKMKTPDENKQTKRLSRSLCSVLCSLLEKFFNLTKIRKSFAALIINIPKVTMDSSMSNSLIAKKIFCFLALGSPGSRVLRGPYFEVWFQAK